MIQIQLPEAMEQQLQERAQKQQRSIETVALELLQDALEWSELPRVDSVVAAIRATPPNPACIQSARGSLAEALLQTSDEPFDQQQWDAEWMHVEQILNTLDPPYHV